MAQQAPEATQEMQAQFQSMQQQQSMIARMTLLMRKRRIAKKLLQKAANRRARAEEHTDTYFGFLFAFAAVVDFVDGLDGIFGFIVMLFTFWVRPFLQTLYTWGPRSYVWKRTDRILIDIAEMTIKFVPWLRTLPAQTKSVAERWVMSIEHRDRDMLIAEKYEKLAQKLLKKNRSK